MTNNIVAVVLLILSGGYFGYTQYNDIDLTVQTIAQMGIGGIGGLFLLIKENFGIIKSLFTKRVQAVNVSENRIFAPENFELKDLECLVHLRNRAKEFNDKEALDAVNKLHSRMFQLVNNENP